MNKVPQPYVGIYSVTSGIWLLPDEAAHPNLDRVLPAITTADIVKVLFLLKYSY